MASGDSKHASTIEPTTTTPPVAAKTTVVVKTGCDVGSAAFDGGCCASTALLKCSGTIFCTDACPAAKTVTTSAESAAATTTVPSTTPSSTLLSTTSSAFPSSTTATAAAATSSTLSTTKSTTTKHSSTLGEAAWTTSQSSAVQLTAVPTTAASHSGLSTGIQAAIGVGSAVVFLLLVTLAIFLCCMARKKKQGEKKKVVEVGVGSDWRRGGYSYKAPVTAVAGLARSASRRLRGYQHDLSGGRYGNNGSNWREGPFPGQAGYDEMPAVELSPPGMHSAVYKDRHDEENKRRLAAIRESIYGP